MPENSTPDSTLEHLDFLLSSFTDNGKSLRGFSVNPQELSVTILTAGLLANSKLMISPDDAVKSRSATPVLHIGLKPADVYFIEGYCFHNSKRGPVDL